MKSRSLFVAVVGVLLTAALAALTAPTSAQPATAARVVRAVTVPVTAPVTGPAQRAAQTAALYATRVGRAVNRQRRAAGLRELSLQSCLGDRASARAVLMARTRLLEHARLEPILTACGLRGVAENIADGFARGRQVVDQGFMKSAQHRRNLLRPRYRSMGVAAAQDVTGVWYVSLLLGRP